MEPASPQEHPEAIASHRSVTGMLSRCPLLLSLDFTVCLSANKARGYHVESCNETTFPVACARVAASAMRRVLIASSIVMGG